MKDGIRAKAKSLRIMLPVGEDGNIGFARRIETICRNAQGQVKWTDNSTNIIPNVGLNHFLNVYYGISAPVTTLYCGLKLTGTPLSTDTMTGAPWSQWAGVSEATRRAYTVSAASGQSVSNSANVIVYGITAATSVAGIFLGTGSAHGSTSGVLAAVGDFSSSRDVVSGDTLNITITSTATSS